MQFNQTNQNQGDVLNLPHPDFLDCATLLVDEQIAAYIGPRMMLNGTSTFSKGVSGKGVISYGLGSMGYDFRLGNDVRVFSNAHSPVVDPMAIDERVFVKLVPTVRDTGYTLPGSVDVFHRHQTIDIPPNGYVLGETVEYLEVPDDVLVIVLGKSTYARCGVIVNCTPLEPGWRGRVTLEIGNLSNCPARVYCGMGIAQALFFRASKRPARTYGQRSGLYQDQTGLTLPRVQGVSEK